MRVQSAISVAVTAITRTIPVAAGAFAPGHLGELTWQIPFELTDAVLEETRTSKIGDKGHGIGVRSARPRPAS